jgi:hypothetical protein
MYVSMSFEKHQKGFGIIDQNFQKLTHKKIA